LIYLFECDIIYEKAEAQMGILDVLDNQEFYELVNFDFEEVREVFNLNDYYVSDEDGDKFIAEAMKVKAEYLEEREKIDDYKKGEYCKIAESRRPRFEEEPAYREHDLESRIRDLLIGLIEEYFDEATYQKYRPLLVKGLSAKKNNENSVELELSLLIEKRFIYAFLSTIGYWQRHNNYFLSNKAFYEICSKYTSEVLRINRELKDKGAVFFNIFLGDCRIDSDKYIDIDAISYIKLITPYLKTNTEQLAEIVKIISASFRRYGESNRWQSAMEEVDNYIAKCENEGLMIAL